MKHNNKTIRKTPQALFLSFFGAGYAPIMPGTIGTLAAMPLLYLFGSINLSVFISIPSLIFLTIFSCVITERVQQKHQLHDPGWIVIDEVIGVAVAWLFYGGNDLTALLAIFILFRFFDIIKIWPASYFDKKIKHGSGVIIDDIISGIYAGIIFKILVHFKIIF